MEFRSRIGEAMKLFVLTLFILGLTLAQSSPVAKKVEKRTAIESSKTDISPKVFNPKDETLKSESFKSRSLKFEESKIEKPKDEKKNEKNEEIKDLKQEDKKDDLRPEDNSETLDIDREKKSCKTVKTAAAPPTKICLEISNAPTQVELCEDDPPPISHEPPQPTQINIEPPPVVEVTQPVYQLPPPQIVYEQPQMMCLPPPQPSTICFETAQQMPQLPIMPVQTQASILPVQAQLPQSTIVQVQPQQQFGSPQTLSEWNQYHKQLHKLHFQLPHQLHNIIHGSVGSDPYTIGHGFGRPINSGIQYVPYLPIRPGGLGSLTSCTCQTGLGNQGSLGGSTLLPSRPSNIVINPGPTGPGGTITISGNGQGTIARNSGGLMFQSPFMNQPIMQQPMMMRQPLSVSSQISGLGRAMDISWGPMQIQGVRHIRGESGSPPQEHALESEQKSHTQSSGKDEQSTQISLSQSSSSASSSPVLKISTPHQPSQSMFSQSSLMGETNSMNEDNMGLRNIEMQRQGLQPFLFGRSRHLRDDTLATNSRYEDMDM